MKDQVANLRMMDMKLWDIFEYLKYEFQGRSKQILKDKDILVEM